MTVNNHTRHITTGLLIIRARDTNNVIYSFDCPPDQVQAHIDRVNERGIYDFVATYNGEVVKTGPIRDGDAIPVYDYTVADRHSWLDRNAANIDTALSFFGGAAVVLVVAAIFAFLVWALVSGGGVAQ